MALENGVRRNAFKRRERERKKENREMRRMERAGRRESAMVLERGRMRPRAQ